VALAAALAVAAAQGGVPAQCSSPSTITESGSPLYLKAGVDTVSWGFFFENTKPAMAVPSGSTVTVEMVRVCLVPARVRLAARWCRLLR
jgi:hypothetical protein